MRLADLDGKRVLVWGLGREGRAALGLLSDTTWCRPASVETFDDGARELSGQGSAQRVSVPEYLLDGVDVIIKSPGVSRYRPEIRGFLAQGGAVTGLTALVIAERDGRRVVGVTGTKGKSTTASLIAHLIAAAGESVELAGNIGRPAVETLSTPQSWVVLECSSYQCADIEPLPGCSPEIGVFSSIYEEHLDWHGTYERYVADKVRLFATCDTTLVNAMQPELVRVTDGSLGPVAGRRLIRDDQAGGDGVLVDLDRVNLQGLHNRRNANLAVHAAAHVMGLVHRKFEDALATFQPLEHRLHTLGRYGNLTVVDDVLATAPEAVLAALEVFADRPVTVLLGGYDREIDYRNFAATLVALSSDLPGTRPRVRVIAMGPAGVRIADEMERAGGARPVTVGSLADAVDLVDPVTPGVLLLSPGATSYGEFADYRERSARFRSLLLQRGMTLG